MAETQILSGKVVSEAVYAGLEDRIDSLKNNHSAVPGLAAVIVGEDPASQVYVRNKTRRFSKLNLHSETIRLPEETSQEELLTTINTLNNDPVFHGILVQLPLPKHIDTDVVINAINPGKDVDGFHPINVGKLLIGDPTGFAPCTPAGVQELLLRSGVEIAGAHVVILGRGNIVGKPLAALLLQKAAGADATVTLCHSRTSNLAAHCLRADILIAAMGQPQFVTAAMVKPGATVIDVGVNRIDDSAAKNGTRLVGDVDFDAVRPIAGRITPNPGGVGPMTIALLLRNTVRAAASARGLNIES